MQFKQAIELIFFTGGVALLLVNMVGLTQSLRNTDIYEENIPEGFGITLTQSEFYSQIENTVADREKYLEHIARTVNEGIAHYWADDGIEKYNLRVPFSNNYLLYFASYVHPTLYLKYEFTDYRRAVERGVGLCSQHAMIASEILRKNNIPSNIVLLDGHVVLRAEASNERGDWWVLDPDYGVLIPHDIYEIENSPALVREYYSSAAFSDQIVEELVSVYGQPGNSVIDGQGARSYQAKKWVVERFAYVAIWLIPAIMMLPIGLRRFGRSRRNSNCDVCHSSD